MNDSLLSLPDDVLCQIVNFLLPSPSSKSFFDISVRHAISLSETCHRLRAVVVQQLSILDFLAPSSYTSLCCRTTQSCLYRIDNLIRSAGQRLRVLHLPHGYTPYDATYSALKSCVNLRELSLPVREELDSNQAHEFFSCFSSLETLTLDIPSPQFILGLCMSDVCLKEVAFTKLPAKTASLNALSSFLGRKGPCLNRLRIDVLAEDTKWNYISSLRGSWVYHEVFMEQERVIRRLSAILTRLSEAKKLSSLRELDVSTIPDFPVESPDDFFQAQQYRNKITHLHYVVKSAREENPQIKGLHKLRMRVPSKILQPSIAFASPWIDSQLDVTFSFPDCTVWIPHYHHNMDEPSAQLTEALIGDTTFQLHHFVDAWNSRSVRALLSQLGRQNFGYMETLTFGTHISTIPQQRLRPTLRYFVRSFVRSGRTKLKAVRFVSNIPNTAAVFNIVTCLSCIDMASTTELREIELPADIVMFSPAMTSQATSLATRTGHHVTTLRISDFRNTTVRERVEQARTPNNPIISEGWITGSAQKAELFLKGLPEFLHMVVQDFPKVETLYMEQTKATSSIGNRLAISRALWAVDNFERVSKADASTLKTEISAWSENPLSTRPTPF